MHCAIRHLLSATLSGYCLISCTTYAASGHTVLEYGCDDVVIVGQAKTVSYSNLILEDDVLGHSVFEMDVSIKRVLYGNETRKIVHAYSTAHAALREDRDIIFVLSPQNDTYVIRSAALRNSRPKVSLAEPCE